MYKVVFLDLDGTLLDDNKVISEENKEAIKYVREKGGLVCLASGRPMDSTKQFWNIAKPSRYMIYSNGAGIYDYYENKNIFLTSIEKIFCIELYNYSIQNNLCIRFDTTMGRFISDEKYTIDSDRVFYDFENFINNDILQISLISRKKEDIDNVVNYINKNLKEDIKIEQIFTTGKDDEYFAVNIVNPDASKGSAINKLCKFLKVDINDVIALGDGTNDISMLKMVGLGVAMGNARPEVKEVAKEVTTTNNDSGVAKVLMSKF